MYPNHDSRLLLSVNARCPYVDAQAVLAFGDIGNNTTSQLGEFEVGRTISLDTGVAIFVGVEGAEPLRWKFWSFPSTSDCVGDAKELPNSGCNKRPKNVALFSVHEQSWGMRGWANHPVTCQQ